MTAVAVKARIAKIWENCMFAVVVGLAVWWLEVECVWLGF